jgi:hypothetical protein
MTNRGTGSPVPGSGIGQVGQVVKDGLCDGTEVIMQVTPFNLIDHTGRLSIRRGSGRSCVMTLDPAIAGRTLSISLGCKSDKSLKLKFIFMALV